MRQTSRTLATKQTLRNWIGNEVGCLEIDADAPMLKVFATISETPSGNQTSGFGVFGHPI